MVTSTPVLSLLALLIAATLATAVNADEQSEAATATPDQELLLFLAEFSDVDDEAFNLLVEKGKQDTEQDDDAPEPQPKARGNDDDQ